MFDDVSLEGWAPEVGPTLPLAEIVDRAFDYRGDVTVVKTDDTEIVGFVFNRDRAVAEPYLRMFARAGSEPLVLRYAEIRTIRFTGKDPAAGNSYAAWLRRKTGEGADRSEPPASASV